MVRPRGPRVETRRSHALSPNFANSLFRNILPLRYWVPILQTRPIPTFRNSEKNRFYPLDTRKQLIHICPPAESCPSCTQQFKGCFPPPTDLYVQAVKPDSTTITQPPNETLPDPPHSACYSAISRCDPFSSLLFRGGPFCCGLWPSSTSSAADRTSSGSGSSSFIGWEHSSISSSK